MTVERRGAIRLKVARLPFSMLGLGDPVAEFRKHESENRTSRQEHGDSMLRQGAPRSLKEALARPIPGFDIDLDELIGPRDGPPLAPPVDFKSPE